MTLYCDIIHFQNYICLGIKPENKLVENLINPLLRLALSIPFHQINLIYEHIYSLEKMISILLEFILFNPTRTISVSTPTTSILIILCRVLYGCKRVSFSHHRKSNNNAMCLQKSINILTYGQPWRQQLVNSNTSKGYFNVSIYRIIEVK